MGKAWRAPARFNAGLGIRVLNYAIESFRDMTGTEYAHRPNGDVARTIEEMISAGPPLHVVTDVASPEALTHVHAIDANGQTRFAVVRDRTCITMLTEPVVARNLRLGHWVHATDQPANGRPAVTPAPRDTGRDVKPANVPRGTQREETCDRVATQPADIPKASAKDVTARDELVVNVPLPIAALAVHVTESMLRLARANVAFDAARREVLDAADAVAESNAALERAVAEAVREGIP